MSQRPGQAAYNAARDLMPGVLDDLPSDLDPFNNDDRLVAFQAWLREKGERIKADFAVVHEQAAKYRDALQLASANSKRRGDTLAAIRAALGCEPGGEVEAVRGLKDAARDIHTTKWPTPGDVLDPADFGRDEAGVLRLAALLSEAPDGAVVDVPEGAVRPRLFYRASGGGDGWAVYADAGCRFHAVGYVSGPVFHAVWLAKRAPLTVVAWPS